MSASNLTACLDSVVAITSCRNRLDFYRPVDDMLILSYGLAREYPSGGAKALGEIPNHYLWEMGKDIFLFNSWYQSLESQDAVEDSSRSGTRVVKFKYKNGKFLGFMPSIIQSLD